MKKELFTIVAAAGRGARFGKDINKAFVDINGIPLMVHTLKALAACQECKDVAVVAAQSELQHAEDVVKKYKDSFKSLNVSFVAGGKERQDSVYNALQIIPEECSYVAVHDVARPFFSPELFSEVFIKAKDRGGAIAAVKAVDTVKLERNSLIEVTLDRKHVFFAQTPQIFNKNLLVKAYETALKEGFVATDDASIVEKFGGRVAIVEGEYVNFKITYPEDLIKAKAVLGE